MCVHQNLCLTSVKGTSRSGVLALKSRVGHCETYLDPSLTRQIPGFHGTEENSAHSMRGVNHFAYARAPLKR